MRLSPDRSCSPLRRRAEEEVDVRHWLGLLASLLYWMVRALHSSGQRLHTTSTRAPSRAEPDADADAATRKEPGAVAEAAAQIARQQQCPTLLLLRRRHPPRLRRLDVLRPARVEALLAAARRVPGLRAVRAADDDDRRATRAPRPLSAAGGERRAVRRPAQPRPQAGRRVRRRGDVGGDGEARVLPARLRLARRGGDHRLVPRRARRGEARAPRVRRRRAALGAPGRAGAHVLPLAPIESAARSRSLRAPSACRWR